MIKPSYLNPGDKVGIAATARKISLSEIQYAINTFTEWGFEVVLPEGLYLQDHQLAGTDAERATALQSLLDNPEIKAVFCARGGYGTIRIVDLLNWELFAKHPKWIVGYSDITVLHGHINQTLGIASLHATMAFNITAEEERQAAIASLKDALTGSPVVHTLNSHPMNKEGNASGVVVGGNLSVLYSMMGSVSFPDTDGKILFLEDLDEYLYHIDRMMMGLKRAGKLTHLAALVVGGMTDMRDNAVPFGKTAEQIIYDAVKEYNYPLYFGLQAGHIANNLALPMGVSATITGNTLTFG